MLCSHWSPPRTHTSLCAHAAVLDEMLARPTDDESTAFWACLLRAFPAAATNRGQYAEAMGNIAIMYAAGTDPAATAIASVLAVLAVDEDATARIEQVCARLPALVVNTSLRARRAGAGKHGNVCVCSRNVLAACGASLCQSVTPGSRSACPRAAGRAHGAQRGHDAAQPQHSCHP